MKEFNLFSYKFDLDVNKASFTLLLKIDFVPLVNSGLVYRDSEVKH